MNKNSTDQLGQLMGFDPQNLSIFKEKPSNLAGANIYAPSIKDAKSDDGAYRSRIRLIYNPFNMDNSILETQRYWLSDVDGGFQVDSKLMNNDKSCPIFVAWKTLRYSKDQDRVDFADKMFQKNTQKWCDVQIISDINNPELAGSFKIMKLPKAIYEKLISKINPAAGSGKPVVPIMDYLIGRALELEIRPGPDDKTNPQRKYREVTYTLSEFDNDVQPIIKIDGTSLFTDEENANIEKYAAERAIVSKGKTPEARNASMKKLMENPITNVIEPLYKLVVEYAKEHAINLETECAYKPWDEITTARVQQWITNVLELKDPQQSTINESGHPQETFDTTDLIF